MVISVLYYFRGKKRKALNKKTCKRRRIEMKKYWIVIIVVVIILILTNPTKEDFYSFVNNKAQQESSSVMEGVLERIIKTPVLKAVTIRKEYVLFSVFVLEFEGRKDVFLGIAKQFIKIRSDLELAD